MRNALLGVVVAVSGVVETTVAVTELPSRAIEFSLPVGVLDGAPCDLVLGGVTCVRLGQEAPVQPRASRESSLGSARTRWFRWSSRGVSVGRS